MAITHVNTQTASASGTSATVTKPTGTASGDLLLALVTTNNQNVTAPSGFTEIADEVIDVFRAQLFYKVAGGSEPANYAFSVTNSTIVVASVAALRGIDTTDPIDIDPVLEGSLDHSEPYTTPGLTGGSAGMLLYFRQARRTSTTEITYTATGVTELCDHGVDNGSVSYSQAVYRANSEYASSGSKSGLAITASATETHTVVGTFAIKAAGVPGSMEVDLLLPSMEASGSAAVPGVLDVDLPQLGVSIDGFYGNTEATLDVQVPVSVDVAAASDTAGPLGVTIIPQLFFDGETRAFGDNTVTPDREERWLVITQDGYYLGLRQIIYLPLIITLPLPQVTFTAMAAAPGAHVLVSATANNVTSFTTSSPQAPSASITVTANGATVLMGETPFAGLVSVSGVANQPQNSVKASAGHVSVSVTANGVGKNAYPEVVTASAVANGATVLTGRLANAGLASVNIHN